MAASSPPHQAGLFNRIATTSVPTVAGAATAKIQLVVGHTKIRLSIGKLKHASSAGNAQDACQG
jgi:hypothetical protein